MKIINKTKYDTAALRKLFSEALARFKKDRPYINNDLRAIRKHLTIEIVSSRGRYSGLGRINGYWMKLRIPAPFLFREKWTSFNPATLVWLFYHELMHNLGHHHNTLIDSQEELEWANAYTVPRREEKQKPAKTVDVKIFQLYERKKKWVSKARRAETAIRKINKSIKYYELKMAASPKAPENPKDSL